jgi:hypothetical protein
VQHNEVQATSALLWLLYDEFETALLDVLSSVDRMPVADEDYSGYRALRGGWEASLHGELVANRKSVQQVRKQVGLDFIRDRIPRETQWEVFAACGYRCVLCGAGGGVPLTVDHIVPISRGGSSRAYNLQALCGPCNSRKRDQYFGDG